jgi:hypothetical protein
MKSVPQRGACGSFVALITQQAARYRVVVLTSSPLALDSAALQESANPMLDSINVVCDAQVDQPYFE